MLQWMGGSRRKVTTTENIQSRKSTQKRQKQYFEQRKRQLQQINDLESYADGKRSCNQHSEYNRSLDVLSLVNLSTVAEKHSPSCLNARDDSEDDGFTLNHQHLHCHPDIYANENFPVDQSEQNEAGTPSSYHTENEYSKKFSIRLSDHNENLDRHNNKFDRFNLFIAPEISVIDLLGDGGANKNLEEISGHAQEAHVAFSVEGLGKVETVTPVHSPETPGSYFLNGFPSPKKSRRQSITPRMHDGFDDLESLEDVMMQDIDFPPYDSLIEHSFCPTDMMGTVSNTNQGFSSCRKSSPFDWNTNTLKGAFDNDDLFFGTRRSGKNIWNGPGFSKESIGELREYGPFGKNWADPSDDDFQSWNLHNKRSSRTSTKRTNFLDMTEPHIPYSKHVISENFDFKVSDRSWYSTCRIGGDVKADDHFVDDMKDSMSLLRFLIRLLVKLSDHSFAHVETDGNSEFFYSEESCSSTAVRGDAMKAQREN